MSRPRGRMLLIGYGNPGRLDDGLGPALARSFEDMELDTVTVESAFQLAVEDAATVAKHDVVIFADASLRGPEPFHVERVALKRRETSFTSHRLEPAEVLGLAYELFGARTRGYVLGIRGHAFDEFGERLSEPAEANLLAAKQFLKGVLLEGDEDALNVCCGAAWASASPVSRSSSP